MTSNDASVPEVPDHRVPAGVADEVTDAEKIRADGLGDAGLDPVDDTTDAEKIRADGLDDEGLDAVDDTTEAEKIRSDRLEL
ncbi:hypothetical protein [Cellulomonas sp. URHD0024]|uniref:hypothetical protein n=1 Tax=Cellulomonas sp. URHD0024 TaxID=1302620 RepID=UPI0003F5E6CF|nr:hypothetical protein [Cellulomonas sp. URHD0024]